MQQSIRYNAGVMHMFTCKIHFNCGYSQCAVNKEPFYFVNSFLFFYRGLHSLSDFYIKVTSYLEQELSSWDGRPFGHNRHGPKIGGCAPFSLGGAGSPSNKKSPGSRPTSIPSGILIHPAVWPQRTCAENWGGGAVPLFGRKTGSASNTLWLGPRPTCMRAKFHLDPSNRLATIHQRHRQTGQDNGPIA